MDGLVYNNAVVELLMSSKYYCKIDLFYINNANSRSVAKKSTAAAHDDNNEVCAEDFNTKMNKKLNKLKSSIISELTENMKALIQSEFWNIIWEYKNQLEEFVLTVAVLHQHVTDLK